MTAWNESEPSLRKPQVALMGVRHAERADVSRPSSGVCSIPAASHPEAVGEDHERAAFSGSALVLNTTSGTSCGL
jgi:hypothetical protein